MSSLAGHLLNSLPSHNSHQQPFQQQQPQVVNCSNGASYDPTSHGRSAMSQFTAGNTSMNGSFFGGGGGGPNMSFGIPPSSGWFTQEVSDASARQIATLQAKLDRKLGPEYISTRAGAGGMKLTYIEGWKAINLANEVFGFNGWSSSITSLAVDFMDYNETTQRYNVGVTAIVRVTLRDGAFHEDVGYGVLENSKQKGAALDKCKKEAVTDGIKRALRNFGNLLGNCLYDKTYTSEVVKIKVQPTKLDRSTLHRRPEFDDNPQPQAGPSTIPPQDVKPLSSVPSHVRPPAPAPPVQKSSPLGNSSSSRPPPHGLNTPGQTPVHQPNHIQRPPVVAAPPPNLGPPKPPSNPAKAKSPEVAPEPLLAPAPSSTQNYFGSDEDESMYAEIDLGVGVEEGTVEEEYVYLPPDEDTSMPKEPLKTTPSPPKPPSQNKPVSEGGRSAVKDMIRRAVEEQQRAQQSTTLTDSKPKSEPTPAVKTEGQTNKPASVGARAVPGPPVPVVKTHAVGGFHFPEGMDLSSTQQQPVFAKKPNPFASNNSAGIKRPADSFSRPNNLSGEMDGVDPKRIRR